MAPHPVLRGPQRRLASLADCAEARSVAPQACAPRPFNFALGDGADMIREAARAFAEKEIAPRAHESDRDNLFPRSWRGN